MAYSTRNNISEDNWGQSKIMRNNEIIIGVRVKLKRQA